MSKSLELKVRASTPGSMGETRIGISGWRYKPWRGTFYPPGLPQKRELEFAARCFNTIEINGSFYSLQSVGSWLRWYEQTPTGFVFSVKGSRYISHMRRLKDIEKPLANFFAQGILGLKEKLGLILWQFPPNFRFEVERLDAFFAMLPTNTHDALAIARHRDHRMKGRTYLRSSQEYSLRHAIEIRHDSFDSKEFLQLLRSYNVGLVIADTAGKWPFLTHLTADFVYVRLHGDQEIYVSGYTPAALKSWASLVRRWQQHRDVYVYFDNDIKVRAPYDAIALDLYLRPQMAIVPKPLDWKAMCETLSLEDFMTDDPKQARGKHSRNTKDDEPQAPQEDRPDDLNSSEQEEENRSIRQGAVKPRENKSIQR